MASLQISDQLIEDIQKILIANDDQAKDIGIAIQYLAAIEGFMLSQYPGSAEQKLHILNQLNAFTEHVLKDNMPQESAVPAGQEAFGIWRPED
jgi:hypothetical protein